MRSVGDAPIVGRERLDDPLTLGLAARLFQRCARRSQSLVDTDIREQIRDAELAGLAKAHRSDQTVAQLADVAGPVIGPHRGHSCSLYRAHTDPGSDVKSRNSDSASGSISARRSRKGGTAISTTASR